MNKEIAIFWFRRDLRFIDNHGLFKCLSTHTTLPIFIFDTDILDILDDKSDARVNFIHQQLEALDKKFKSYHSGLHIMNGKPVDCFKNLLQDDALNISAVYTNRDYEPYAKKRDAEIEQLLKDKGVSFHTFQDHVIFEPDTLKNQSGDPYKVYTPFRKLWEKEFQDGQTNTFPSETQLNNLYTSYDFQFLSLEQIGFKPTSIVFPNDSVEEEILRKYDQDRDYPAKKGTSRLGVHLRHGTVSIRQIVRKAKATNDVFLSELIWREFYIMIMDQFPHVVEKAFKPAYEHIPWINDEAQFEAWCEGKTGYPIVDAGMRELNNTGYMHNRIRMVTASFLTKHLLIDWRWGEAYFAKKLLDFELASNNGGWQWAAGTGTDAQPYFRVFNPDSQTKKFDPELKYIKKWVPELNELDYPKPIVDHKTARERAIATYKDALN